MQKLTLLFILLVTGNSVFAQTSAKKYLLIEHFTNSNCSSCGAKNPAFFNLIDDYPDDIHHISIHPPIPYASCAFYQANPSENSARSNYYNVFGTPSIAINGEFQPISTPILTANTLQSYLGQTSPMWIQVTESGVGANRTATVKVHTLDVIPGSNFKFYAAIVEKTVNYQGTNSETVHHNVFRDMLTNINGDDFTPAAPGQNVEFTFNYSISGSWNANEIYVLAWVQKPGTKEVVNSGTIFDPTLVSTDELAPKTVQIQPNPVTDIARAQIGDDTARQIEIFAADGQRVSVSFENEEVGVVSIPTETFAKGIYFVKITGENGVYVAKMLKQ